MVYKLKISPIEESKVLSVSSPEKGEIWRHIFPVYAEDRDSGELVEEELPFELGIMKDESDVNGLRLFLISNGFISEGDTVEL